MHPMESDGSGGQNLGRRSSSAGAAMARAAAAIRAASAAAGSAFQELRRSLAGNEAYIEPSRLRTIRALGKGAFGSMKHAVLRPASGQAAGGRGAAEVEAAGLHPGRWQ